MLKEGQLTAGDIALKLDVSPAALSYHLKLLKNAGLVMYATVRG
ncbi:MAG: ArsR family transcriptional regulator [Lachnospiraceae bacterium]